MEGTIRFFWNLNINNKCKKQKNISTFLSGKIMSLKTGMAQISSLHGWFEYLKNMKDFLKQKYLIR